MTANSAQRQQCARDPATVADVHVPLNRVRRCANDTGQQGSSCLLCPLTTCTFGVLFAFLPVRLSALTGCQRVRIPEFYGIEHCTRFHEAWRRGLQPCGLFSCTFPGSRAFDSVWRSLSSHRVLSVFRAWRKVWFIRVS